MAGETNTNVAEVDIDIATLLAQPGAENIITATTEDDVKKNSMFQRNKGTDVSFIDKPGFNKPAPETDPEKIKAAAEAAETKKQQGIADGILNPDGTPKIAAVITNEINDIINNVTGSEEEASGKGRPKVDKDGLYELTKNLIEKKLIFQFDDDKPLEKYTQADYQELYEANDQERQRRLENEVPGKFFDQLPDKLKTAAAYFANGGTDSKGIFRALAEYEENTSLDPETEQGQESITRQYLQSTKFGTTDEIEAQINEWKDHEILDKKANQFKPKLDALQEQYLAYKVKEQENLRKQQQEQSNLYMKNVYETLEPGELNGIKIEKKTQGMLYAGLVQPNYPSISGKNTNLLGHLLEKYQFVEPRHDLIAEALWLLADPDGYKAKLREGGKKDATLATVRTLKTEEAKKLASTTASEEDDATKKEYKIPRPNPNTFFKRQ